MVDRKKMCVVGYTISEKVDCFEKKVDAIPQKAKQVRIIISSRAGIAQSVERLPDLTL